MSGFSESPIGQSRLDKERLRTLCRHLLCKTGELPKKNLCPPKWPEILNYVVATDTGSTTRENGGKFLSIFPP